MENTAERDSQSAGLPRRGERREAARGNPASEDASMASVHGPTGVVTGRGMCEEKRMDEPVLEGRHLELGRPGECTRSRLRPVAGRS